MDQAGRLAREQSPSDTDRRSVGEEEESTRNFYQPPGHSDDMSSLGFRGSEDQSMVSLASSLQQSISSNLWAARRRSDIPLTIQEGEERNSSHTNRQGSTTSSAVLHGSTHSGTSELTMGAANLSNRSLNFNHRNQHAVGRLEPLAENPATAQDTNVPVASLSRSNSTENQEEMSTTDFQQTERATNLRSSLGLGTVFTTMSADTENEEINSARVAESEGRRLERESEQLQYQSSREISDGVPNRNAHNLAAAPSRNPDEADASLFNGSFVLQDSASDIPLDEATFAMMDSNHQFFERKSLGSPTNDIGEPQGQVASGPPRRSATDDVTAYTMGSNVQYFGRTTPSTVGGDRPVGGTKTPSPVGNSLLGSKTRSEQISQSFARGRTDSKDDATAYTMGSNVQYFGRTTPSAVGGGRSVGGSIGAKTPSPLSASGFGSKTRQSPALSLANTNVSGPSSGSRPSPDTNSLAGTDFLTLVREMRAISTPSPSGDADPRLAIEKSQFDPQTHSSDMQSQAGSDLKPPSPSADFEDLEGCSVSERRYYAEDNSAFETDDNYVAKKRDDQSTVHGTRSLDGSSSHLDRTTYSRSSSAYGSLYRDTKKVAYKSDSSVASTKSSGSRETIPYVLRPSNTRPRSMEASEVEVSMDGFLHPSKTVYADADDEITKADAKSYRSLGRTYYNDGDDRGDDFTYVDTASHTIPGLRSRMVLIFSLLLLLGTSVFSASRVGPFYVSPETVVSQEQAASLLRQSRILDLANIQTSTTSSGSTSGSSTTSSSSGSTASMGTPAVSGLTTMGSSTAVVSTTNGRRAVADSAQHQRELFTNWVVPYGGLGKELPTVWSFELSGGDIVQRVFGQCLGKVQAANGADFDSGNEFGKSWVSNSLKVVTVQGQHFVNVDMLSVEGIDRAARLQLAQAHVAEVMVSPLLHEMAKVFQANDPRYDEVTGRLMVVFRDPVKRALNRFEEIRRAQGTDFSLMKYAQSNVYNENNPLTRAILGLSKSDPLNDKALKVAIQFIDNKVLVGLFEQMEETLNRFEQFFGWHSPTDTPCHNHVKQEWATIYSLDVAAKYEVTDPFAYNMVVAQHRMDIKVYRHAKALWAKQLKQLTQG